MWNLLLYLISGALQIHTVSSKPGRPKSVCEKWRYESFKSLHPSTYVPTCKEDGSFAKTQCHFEVTKIRCWEVDKYGKPTGKKRPDIILPPQPRRNTERYPPQPRRNTERYLTRTLNPITNDASATMFGYTRTDSATENEIVETIETNSRQPITNKPLTKCERLRVRKRLQWLNRKATAIPACTKDGHFKKEQCNVERSRCWCVGSNGKKIPGSRVRHRFPNCYPDKCGKRFEKRPSRHRRVVGGRESAAHTWPWQAVVLFSDPKHICGATLVKRNWLVTAASCFDNFPKRKSEWNVKLGVHKLNTSNEDKLSVEAIHIHPNYRPGNKTHPGDYDVALIQVSSSARIPRHVMPLCLPDKIDFYKEGARCSITGWGHTSYNGSLSRVLREAWVDLVPLNECNSEKSYNGAINDRFMCAGYKEGGMDACHFDTGGPLACPISNDGRWALAGIVSWRQTCAQPFKYGVYTNVHVVKPWIDQIIKR